MPDAQTAGAVLGLNFPSSEWSERAHALLASAEVSASIEGGSGLIEALMRAAPSDAPKVHPKAPGPGQPTAEDMPAPKVPAPALLPPLRLEG